MSKSNILNISHHLYSELEDVLLRNVPKEYIDSVSTGFLYYLYESFLNQLSIGNSIDQHYTFLLEMYTRDLPFISTNEKIAMFNANHSVISLTSIDDYLTSLSIKRKYIGPIQCKRIINLTQTIYLQSNDINRQAALIQFKAIINNLKEISPRSHVLLSRLQHKYCTDTTPKCGGVITIYDEIIGIINFFLLPLDCLIYLYQKL